MCITDICVSVMGKHVDFYYFNIFQYCAITLASHWLPAFVTYKKNYVSLCYSADNHVILQKIPEKLQVIFVFMTQCFAGNLKAMQRAKNSLCFCVIFSLILLLKLCHGLTLSKTFRSQKKRMLNIIVMYMENESFSLCAKDLGLTFYKDGAIFFLNVA